MTPLDKIAAVAGRLQQESDTVGRGPLAVRLREMSATLRAGVAQIRRACEATAAARGRVLANLVIGDEETGK